MTAVEKPVQNLTLAHALDYSQEQITLIRQTLAPETNDLEFQLFMEVARVQGLSPLQRQIHAVMRWDNATKRKKMMIQTGIDGYRLIAARTGSHLGTTDATFGPNNAQGFPAWAQVTVKKLVHGHIAEYPATAFWDEYVQTTKDGTPNSMWAGRPKGQLSKCAEALALRKAFPAELSGVYTDTEMEQADNPAPLIPAQQETKPAQQGQGQTDDTEAKLQAWAKSIGDMAERVRKIAPPHSETEVQATLDLYNWRSDTHAAKGCYEDLKALGTRLQAVKEAQQGQQGDAPMVADTMASKEQIGQLQAAAKGMGADTSEKRAALWGHWLEHAHPCPTKTLNEEEAAWLINTKLAKLNAEQRADELKAALAKFGGAA